MPDHLDRTRVDVTRRYAGPRAGIGSRGRGAGAVWLEGAPRHRKLLALAKEAGSAGASAGDARAATQGLRDETAALAPGRPSPYRRFVGSPWADAPGT